MCIDISPEAEPLRYVQSWHETEPHGQEKDPIARKFDARKDGGEAKIEASLFGLIR